MRGEVKDVAATLVGVMAVALGAGAAGAAGAQGAGLPEVDVRPSKAFFAPGEAVELGLVWPALADGGREGDGGAASVVISHGAERLAELHAEARPGVTVRWSAPRRAPAGYGVDVVVRDASGEVVARGSGAFDVLDSWVQAPRYGFLSDFPPDRQDAEATMEILTRYHVNGLQFYDWMYRHEQLLTSDEPYRDPLGRLLSYETVARLIEAAHRRRMAAMPYTAAYGASMAFYRVHPDWALFRSPGGKPILFGTDFLAIMNPAPGSPWTAHLLAQFEDVLRRTAFDGIHIDQYGDPKFGFDAEERSVDVAEALRALIDATKERAEAVRPGAAVVFNAVNNWPIDAVAPSRQDFTYIEVWPPHTTYRSLWGLVTEAERLGNGKPVVLAAYQSPVNAVNVRLTDAVIFASGGSHIELGERGVMLADPYFPKYEAAPEELGRVLRSYYDFAVRYENFITAGPSRGRDVTREELGRLRVGGAPVDEWTLRATPGPGADVMVVARGGEGWRALHLINLSGLDNLLWKGELKAGPAPQSRIAVRYYLPGEASGRAGAAATWPSRIWWASPDAETTADGAAADLSAHSLAWTTGRDAGGAFVEFVVPKLTYWTTVVLEG